MDSPGYFLSLTGFVMSNPCMTNWLMLIIFTICQILRASKEEEFLSSDEIYKKYKQNVRWRFVPLVF